ncbi:MAG: YicC family protein [Proteobacteria bacterium]|jgi:uncharacterized protein (TIGR00255 family)|nr:YicC family protein [Pseudomonadota bacterium]MDA1299944.1 YicC family protein [Pseudomonadota bacterium]
MTKSMTAFAQIERDGVSWEIRSVNQRYLDINFRLPEATRTLEPLLRSLIKSRLTRGKIDCSLRTDEVPGAGNLVLDTMLIRRLAELATQVNDITGDHQQLNALELLKWPGAIREADRNDNSDVIVSMFEQALDQLQLMRGREGAVLAGIIEEKLTRFSQMVQDVREAAPAILAENQGRMLARLAEMKVDADPGRLEQEMVLAAQKADITEELDRLDTHITEVRKTLAEDGTIGRRLDFLMQELNREANTLSSKAIAADSSVQAVDMKVIIEQMREQIQNIE